MFAAKKDPARRKRAPSQRSIETGQRIFDAAERLFAERGFEGTSVRDIAGLSGVTPALVSFHGGSKLALFEAIVERRAGALSRMRLDRLAAAQAAGRADLKTVLECFVLPLLEKAQGGDAQWLAYARLVAIVSSDAQWASLTRRCFDPTVAEFSLAISTLCPQAEAAEIAAGLVFTVAAMLSLCTAQWRVAALAGPGGDGAGDPALNDRLIRYCEAGLIALIGPPRI